MRAVLSLLALGACAEPVVDMRLVMPQQVPANFDLSCVKAVDVAPHRDGVAPIIDIGLRKFELKVDDPCVDISPQTSFAGVLDELRGQVSFDLDDLAGVQIRGRVGSCNDDPNYHEAIFYGGAVYDGGDINIPLIPNISCTGKEMQRVKPFELIPMIADPLHACKPIIDNLAATFPGVIRPSKLDPVTAPLTFEAGTGVAPLDGNGVSTIPTFSSTMQNDACIAVAHEGPKGSGGTCVNKNAPPLCGTAGDVELPLYPFILVEPIIDKAAIAESGTYVIGTVWETNPAKPVADATVTAPAGVKVDYVELKNGVLEVVRGGTKTGPSGLFILYSPKVVSVTIAAPGHQSRTLTVGGGFELPGSALAVLPKM